VTDDPGEEVWAKMLEQKARNSQKEKYQPMLAETRALLEAFYKPYNKQLMKILADRRWLWGGTAAAAAAAQRQQQQHMA
jgi:hypothetical protein